MIAEKVLGQVLGQDLAQELQKMSVIAEILRNSSFFEVLAGMKAKVKYPYYNPSLAIHNLKFLLTLESVSLSPDFFTVAIPVPSVRIDDAQSECR